MAMDSEELAKRIKNELDKGIKKGYQDHTDSGAEQKQIQDYKKKDEEKKLQAKQPKGVKKNKISKIPSIPDPELEKLRCPYCGHINCGCKYNKKEEEKEEETPSSPTDEEIGDILEEGDFDKLKDLVDNAPNSNFTSEILDAMGKAIDDEFQKAECSLAIPCPSLALISKGTLRFNLKSNFILNAIEIGLRCSIYWTPCILPMVGWLPQQAGVVTVVQNDAFKIAAPIAQRLIMLSFQAIADDDYKEMAKIIVEEVKGITWNITEVIPGTPPVTVQYTSTVS